MATKKKTKPTTWQQDVRAVRASLNKVRESLGSILVGPHVEDLAEPLCFFALRDLVGATNKLRAAHRKSKALNTKESSNDTPTPT